MNFFKLLNPTFTPSQNGLSTVCRHGKPFWLRVQAAAPTYNLKKLFAAFFYIFSLLLYLLPQGVWAYQPTTTHAGLTQEIVDFYNATHSQKLSGIIKEKIIQGSIEEDIPAVRALNHFYDPIRNMGINNARTSKSWALDNLPENEFSWPKAVQYYAEGDETKAYISLGHVIHLLEDMTVPDHTRNDPHAGDGPAGLYTNESPYESWTDKNKDRGSLKYLHGELLDFGTQPKKFLTITEYFDFLANYSNKNFFSRDTIYSAEYSEPIGTQVVGDYEFGKDSLDFQLHKLVIVSKNKDGVTIRDLLKDNDSSVLSDYFDRLGKQAILAGAGVIELFLKEGEKARGEYLAQKEADRKKAVAEAVGLNKKLSSSGIVSTIAQGARFFLKDKITTPVVGGAKSLATNFGKGSTVVFNEAANAGSFAAYTTKELATTAVKSASAGVASAVDKVRTAIKSIGGQKNPGAVVLSLPAVDNKTNIGKADLSLPLPDILLQNSKKIPAATTPVAALIRATPLLPVSSQRSDSDVHQSGPLISPPVTPQTVAPVPASTVGQSSPPAVNQSPKISVPDSPQIETGPTGGLFIGLASPPAVSLSNPPAVSQSNSSAATTTLIVQETALADSALDSSASTSTLQATTTSLTDNSQIVSTLSTSSPQASSTGSLQATTTSEVAESQTESETASSTPEVVEEPAPVEAEELPLPVPVTPPDLTFSIPECGLSLSSDVCLLTNGAVTLSWSSTAENVDFYLLNDNGNLTKLSSTTLSATINIENDSLRVFSLAAYAIGSVEANTTGQASSATSSQSVYVSAAPVVINEVAWSGTASHPEDEWIELYNRSPYNINLSGLTLFSKTDMNPYINLSGSISSGGYYLIERKNDGETDESTQSPIKDIVADLWTSFGFGLNNAGENLVLSTIGTPSAASTTLDEISLCTNWCGASSGYSYERYSPDEAGPSAGEVGSNNSNWGSNYGLIINGKNVSGADVNGTPKARNSLNYLVNKNSDITSNLTLKKNNSPYVVDDKTIQISSGKTLTIEPGVVIKFNKAAKIKASGNVVADGTEENPIVFTAFADDLYGGDTDGVSAMPVKGAWFGVELYPGDNQSSFNHTIFRYGGNYGNGLYKKAMLYAESVSPSISNSVFEYSKAYGLSLKNSGANVNENIFRFNTGTTFSTGLYLENGSGGAITGNQFSDNATGLSLFGFAGDIKDNIFSNNTVGAFILSGPFVGSISGNSGSGNSSDTIDLQDSISLAGATTTLSYNPMPYFLSGPVTVPALSALVLQDGVTVKANLLGSPGSLNVSGRLETEGPPAGETGSSQTGVTFTSTSAYGDKGAWKGIVMSPNSSSNLRGLNVNGANIGIKYTRSTISLENVLFSNNTTAIHSSASTVSKATDVVFSNNTTDQSPPGLW